MNNKEKDSKEKKSKEQYDWRGNVAVYSERYGWHLRPTEPRKEQKEKSSVSKEE